MSTRIRATATGTPAERIATETHIFYEPVGQTANIIFQGEEFLLAANGQPCEKLEGRQSLSVSLAEIGERTFNAGIDPVTGEDLSRISVAGLGNIIRAVYDELHSAQYAPIGD